MDFREVRLILGGGGGPGPDGVAKVEGAQAGHHRVQVDDAQGPARLPVKEHIADLGVVVGHPQRKPPLAQQIHQQGGASLPCLGKSQLRFHLREPPSPILLGGLPKLLAAHRRVMKVRDGLVEGLGRIAGEQALEFSKGPAGLPQHGGALRRFKGLGPRHIGHAAPEVPVPVHEQGLPRLGGAQ